MPGNILSADSNFPQLSQEQSSDEKIQIISDYLYMLLEMLRYSMANLGVSNFNSSELNELAKIITDPVYMKLDDEVNGLHNEISVTAEGINVRLTDEVNQLQNTITVTAAGINTRITDEVNGLSNEISVTASGILTRLDDEVDGLNTTISVTASGINTRITNEVNGLNNQITTTASGIYTRISNEVTGLNNNISVTAQGLQAQISTNAGNITSLTATANGIASRVSSAEGNITTLSQTVNGLSLSASNGTTSSTLSLMAGNTSLSSASINFTGYVTFSSLGYGGSTNIDGSRITTGTISADRISANGLAAQIIQGGTIYIKDTAGNYCGIIYATNTTTGYGVELYSYSGLKLTSPGKNIYIARALNNYILIEGGIVKVCGSALQPNNGSGMTLGTSSWKWTSIYASTSTISTSDARHKTDIEALPDKYVAMLEMLEPRRFKMRDGTSGRFHAGFIAQEVESAMEFVGLSSGEFAGLVKDVDSEGEELYMLRYSEFIAPLLGLVKKLSGKVEALTGRIAELEGRLQ